MKKYKVYEIGGADYSALSFEQRFKGKSVADAIKELLGDKDSGSFSDDSDYFEISFLHETSDKKAFFAQRARQDYDDSKHKKLFLEDEILKG